MKIADPFDTAMKATAGVMVALFLFVVLADLLFSVAKAHIGADDVRAVCAAHGGVSSIYEEDGLLLPSRLVLCRDGYVAEPKP